jgi:hypothetical protein
MTSLIFGGIVMAHQGVVQHRRDKQRTKNYQRWEDLRDEYDEQKKITRQSRSLDIQRTGNYFDDQPILTLRDQQEANDARMSWRPQESWEPSHIQQPMGHQLDRQSISTPSAYWQSRGEIRPQKTGVTWDEGLPPPLKVSRRSFEEEHNSPRIGRAQSVQMESAAYTSRNASPLSQEQSRTSSHSRPQASHTNTAPPTMYHVEPVESHVPGGRMAELIERGY